MLQRAFSERVKEISRAQSGWLLRPSTNENRLKCILLCAIAGRLSTGDARAPSLGIVSVRLWRTMSRVFYATESTVKYNMNPAASAADAHAVIVFRVERRAHKPSPAPARARALYTNRTHAHIYTICTMLRIQSDYRTRSRRTRVGPPAPLDRTHTRDRPRPTTSVET